MMTDRMLVDLDNDFVRESLRSNLDLLLKNIETDDKDHRLYSAEDLLNLFCWQVNHNEKPDQKVLKFLAQAIGQILNENISPEVALGLSTKPGQPKLPPGRDFWFACFTQLERFGDLHESDVLSHQYLPVSKEHYDACRQKHPSTKQCSLETACEFVALLYNFTPDLVKKAYQKMKAADQCPCIATAKNAPDVRTLLEWGHLFCTHPLS